MILPKPPSGEGGRERLSEAISWSVREGRPRRRPTDGQRTAESNEFQSGPLPPPPVEVRYLFCSISFLPSLLPATSLPSPRPPPPGPDFTLRAHNPAERHRHRRTLPPLLHSSLRDGILKFLADKLAVRLDLASFVIFIGMSRKGPSHLNLYPPVTCYSADPSTEEPP